MPTIRRRRTGQVLGSPSRGCDRARSSRWPVIWSYLLRTPPARYGRTAPSRRWRHGPGAPAPVRARRHRQDTRVAVLWRNRCGHTCRVRPARLFGAAQGLPCNFPLQPLTVPAQERGAGEGCGEQRAHGADVTGECGTRLGGHEGDTVAVVREGVGEGWVGNTCVAALALLRLLQTHRQGVEAAAEAEGLELGRQLVHVKQGSHPLSRLGCAERRRRSPCRGLPSGGPRPQPRVGAAGTAGPSPRLPEPRSVEPRLRRSLRLPPPRARPDAIRCHLPAAEPFRVRVRFRRMKWPRPVHPSRPKREVAPLSGSRAWPRATGAARWRRRSRWPRGEGAGVAAPRRRPDGGTGAVVPVATAPDGGPRPGRREERPTKGGGGTAPEPTCHGAQGPSKPWRRRSGLLRPPPRRRPRTGGWRIRRYRRRGTTSRRPPVTTASPRHRPGHRRGR